MSSLILSSPAPVPALPWRLLGGLTLLVLLLHWGLLGGLAPLAGAWDGPSGATATAAFETRTITLPAPQPAPPSAAPVVRKPAPTPMAAAPNAEPATLPEEATPPQEPPPPEQPPENNSGVGLAVASAAFFTGAALAQENPPMPLGMPPSARLKYDIKGEAKGFPYSAKGELLWSQDGKSYDARMEISHFLLGSRVQTSRGTITPRGLEPIRFGDKVRSEVAAHFERDKGKVSFSANTPDVPLEPGAQDNLSVFIQLAALMGANSGRFPSGTSLSFQTIGPRQAETWTFKIGQAETLKLPGGDMLAIRLVREATGDNDARAELWMAPSLGYLPVRIKLTQNGDVVDQLWRSTQNP